MDGKQRQAFAETMCVVRPRRRDLANRHVTLERAGHGVFAWDEPVSAAVMAGHYPIAPVIGRAQGENHHMGFADEDFRNERLEQLPRPARHILDSQRPVGSVRRRSVLPAKDPFENFIRCDLFGRCDRKRILPPHLCAQELVEIHVARYALRVEQDRNVNKNIARLTNAIDAIHCLRVLRRIPMTFEMDDVIRGGNGEADTRGEWREDANAKTVRVFASVFSMGVPVKPMKDTFGNADSTSPRDANALVACPNENLVGRP